MSKNINRQLPSYGGQAVIEGVLMRGVKHYAIAVRDPDGNLRIKTEKLSELYGSKIIKIPFLRGLILLWDSLGLGTKALSYSAQIQSGEEEDLSGAAYIFTLILSFSIAIVMFFVLPSFFAKLITQNSLLSPFAVNLIEGCIRLSILVLYIWAIGFIPDIKRVFAYHGAEHKTINAFESNIEMSPERVNSCSREHPRCGTAFLLTLVIVSVFVFSVFGDMSLLLRIVSRILLIPVIAGIAYEIIRFTAKFKDNPIIKLVITPNLLLQRLTTREPDQGMLEVSIAAFNTLLEMEKESV